MICTDAKNIACFTQNSVQNFLLTLILNSKKKTVTGLITANSARET